MSSYQKKRQGGYYNQNSYKRKRNFLLEPGVKGFICTCNNREKDCLREAFNILNYYADRLYGNQNTPSEDAKEPVEENADEDDVETVLSKEISNLKQSTNKQWQFNMIESGANNCVFIKTTLPNPTELAHYIVTDIGETKIQRSRFLLRLIPVETTCKAYMEDIRKNAAVLFDKYFTKEAKTFAIAFNHRNNNNIKRSEIIEEFAHMIKLRHIDNKVHLSQPQYTVIIEVMRSMCCMSVVPDYFKFLKYNLLELSGKGDKAAIEARKVQEEICNRNSLALEEEEASQEKDEEDQDITGAEETECPENVLKEKSEIEPMDDKS